MTRAIPVGHPADIFRDQMRVQLPTRAGLQSALALMPKPESQRHLSRHGRRYESPVWFLTISPGTVRVTCRLTMAKVTLDHNGLMEDDTVSDAPTRGRVADFSDKARARMTDVFRSLDYSPLFEDGGIPALVTFTAPGDWESVFPTPRDFKKKVNLFKQEYKRAWGRDLTGVWKMEFQERGAPHLHVLMTPPRSRTRATGESFRDWASKTWARLCNAQGAQAYADHLGRGVDISWEEGQRYSDPRRIAVYFDKHAGYHEKDYQNVMPQLWLSAIADGQPGATYWGYWQLEKMVETIELVRDPGARMRRASRQDVGFVEVRQHNAMPNAAMLAGVVPGDGHYVKTRLFGCSEALRLPCVQSTHPLVAGLRPRVDAWIVGFVTVAQRRHVRAV